MVKSKASEVDTDLLKEVVCIVELEGGRKVCNGLDSTCFNGEYSHKFALASDDQKQALRDKWDLIRRWTITKYLVLLENFEISPGIYTVVERQKFEEKSTAPFATANVDGK